VRRLGGTEPSTGAVHSPLTACSPSLPWGAAAQTTRVPSGARRTSVGSHVLLMSSGVNPFELEGWPELAWLYTRHKIRC